MSVKGYSDGRGIPEMDRKESPIESEMMKLDNFLSTLAEALSGLSVKLNGILALPPPAPCNEKDGKLLSECLCPLAEEIRRQGFRVIHMNNQLQDILERIQL